MTKNILFTATVFAACGVILGGCANPFTNDTGSRPTLPESWYQSPEKTGGQRVGKGQIKPSEKMTESVRTAFRVHSQSLDAITMGAGPELTEDFALVWQPPNYTPWHLDGMIVNFAVSGEGIFGPLMLAGEASVKATWQSVQAKKRAGHSFVAASKTKKKAFKFRSTMTDQEIATLLEPAVRTAVATKAVTNERAFRKNLRQQGKSFVRMAKLMNRVPQRRSWQLHGYELKLAFSAEGQVSATMGVGGAITIYFKWEQEEKGESFLAPEPFVGLDGVLYQNLVSFVRAMGSILPDALNEAVDIRRSGFEIREFEVGVGVTAGGDIGVAKVEGAAAGKMSFLQVGGSHSLHGLTEQVNEQVDEPQDEFITMVSSSAPSPESLTYAQVSGTAVQQLTGGDSVYRVARHRFKEGMKEAIEMGSYFATEGRRVDTGNWKLTKIETEFESTIGGDFSVVTVEGKGNFVLVFERHGM